MYAKINKQSKKWGFSSVGRAPALHAGGQEFESPKLHHLDDLLGTYKGIEFFYSLFS